MRQRNPLRTGIFIRIIILSVLILFILYGQNAPAADTKKANAYRVLNAKCNVCHRKQNKHKVFTLINMDGFAAKIKTQVFIKKRMPRGNKIKLTPDEYQTLNNWIININ